MARRESGEALDSIDIGHGDVENHEFRQGVDRKKVVQRLLPTMGDVSANPSPRSSAAAACTTNVSSSTTRMETAEDADPSFAASGGSKMDSFSMRRVAFMRFLDSPSVQWAV